ncbi:hypothetical protein COY25_01300 [Candidatus Uhrbacteria bacterium CG_4_10_14_0_2_um_filter_41_7]|uniref:Uncharacterized protein n=1 Tax=Candidatus Uhrbacteria bacterium CG_4_9_14_3_um_filter_41_35 TaxID=1975034 RepID=A0A2M7XDA8_9BACT|nr:MAG: hypothetical protein COY25_01300 [Candidatus Uhrbacteria bacterium CG_4_10_14_0_2_um_filter_41_7]PJA45854.1 MAG: hypothetical protein CO173_04355 [Candidatus Uhrbacteria bacterium CG_4_9_14_3_um_filter_41_35]
MQNKVHYIVDFGSLLEKFFQNKEYGSGLKEIVIGMIVSSPAFESTFLPRRTRFIKGKKIIKFDNTISFTVEDSFSFETKLDYENFKNADEKEIKQMIAETIWGSFLLLKK